MTLSEFLVKQKAVTGPLEKNTSHSHLDNLKRALLGFPPFESPKAYLFGEALHKLFLENKRGEAYKKLDSLDRRKIEIMVSKLNSHPAVRKLKENSVCEDKKYGKLFGMDFSYILDIDQPAIGSDLKSTSCKTFDSCKKSYVSFGYTRQGWLYKQLTKKKQFFFIFICKHPPHSIFILNTADFKYCDRIAEKEIEFLVYFYKHYGNINLPNTLNNNHNGTAGETNKTRGTTIKSGVSKSKTRKITRR